tara:strand:+ start:690 stop:926 length:237 start_codon:yes stop_codon:yes gene_type:complete
MNRKVIVEWIDAWTSGGWSDTYDARPAKVFTMGLVLEENEKGIMVAQSYTADGGFGNLTFIPNEDINTVTYLKEGGPA